MARLKIKYNALPTIREYHRSTETVKAVMGPIGSGKSVGSIVEMWEVSRKQYPSPDGVRYTRWAVVRNSYPELKSTTIKTFQEWIPETICPIVYDSPIRGLINQKLPDGTRMHAEFLFLSLDKEKDISKLLSLELTGIFINEAREMPFNLVKSALSRTGRYPGKTKCPDGLRWTGMIMDTNPPDDDHWWYNLAENVKPDGWAFFKQPGALLPVYNSRGEITGYEANPAAENVENHQEGYRYWMKNVAASDEDWIKVYCCGEYGSIFDGKPVYKGFWSDQKHIASKPLGVFRGLPLTLMWDWGLTPAVAIGQVTPRGQFRILRELCCEDGGLKQFASNDVIPYLNQVFTGMKILSVGDPAGSQRSQGDDEITCFGILKSLGIPTEEAPTNKFEPRREAVINRLSRMTDGEPAFIVDPSCKMIIKGFRGGYKFEKVQVSGSDERFKEIACKNKFSHIHDALQYGCLFVDSVNTFQSAPPPPPIDASWDGMV